MLEVFSYSLLSHVKVGHRRGNRVEHVLSVRNRRIHLSQRTLYGLGQGWGGVAGGVTHVEFYTHDVHITRMHSTSVL